MKVVTLIPHWDKYEYENKALIDRDMLDLSGRALLNYPIELSNKTRLVSATYIFTNDQKIAKELDPRLKYTVLRRDVILDSQDATVEQIIRYFLNSVPADVVVLLHANSPFIKKESLEECIRAVTSGKHDSAFLARSEKRFSWYKGRRINYEVMGGTPHLSLIEPIMFETSSAYIFTRDCFEKTGTRIGEAPYIKEVGVFEGLVISTPEDMKMAEYLLDSQFGIDG